jgi:integrase
VQHDAPAGQSPLLDLQGQRWLLAWSRDRRRYRSGKERDDGSVATAGSRWTVTSWLEHWLENIARPTIRHTSYDAYRIAVRSHLVAALARPPRLEVEPIKPYSLEEVQLILSAARSRRNGARWAIALALGLRQGEVLGLQWPDVDLDEAEVRVSESRPRPKYRHGCSRPCGQTPGHCPDRVRANRDRGSTKSFAGNRTVGLPAPLVQLLREHQLAQALEREEAGQLWIEGGWVFTSETGQPINPSTDYHAWKALLRRAGVRDARLHDARHTTATVLLVLGVPERTVMDVMGWSSTAMAARYQHVTDPIRREVATRIGGLLWAPKTPTETRSETEALHAAQARIGRVGVWPGQGGGGGI